MAKDIMFLVRGGDGQMRTIMAPNKTQALKEFLRRYPARAGDEVSLKVRGEGDWEEYEVREQPKPRAPKLPDYTRTKAR